jgi:aminoglycoside/choline kinase family phosphotransferase
MVSDPNPAFSDFQDELFGPITYDLASLYKDAYIAWSEERVIDWVVPYWEECARCRPAGRFRTSARVYRVFEWMGASAAHQGAGHLRPFVSVEMA